MATAKQIAARKEFARIMKSGGFPAAKKRKKNPLARSGANARQNSEYDDERSENPIARSGKNSRALSTNVQAGRNSARRDLSGTRRKNPVGRGGSNSRPAMSNRQAANDPNGYRMMNPTHAVGRYQVFAARHGIAGKLLATFPSKADAMTYAKAWSDAKNCPVILQGRRA